LAVFVKSLTLSVVSYSENLALHPIKTLKQLFGRLKEAAVWTVKNHSEVNPVTVRGIQS